jgi:predicted amidohydrolase
LQTPHAAGVLITLGGIAADSAHLKGYATEHRMVVVMANHASPTGGWATAGLSTIWDERGREVVASPADGETILIAGHEDGVLRGELIHP